MTKEQWIEKLSKENYFMDRWDSEDSFEIYVPEYMDSYLGIDTLKFNRMYRDSESMPLWCIHLYAYIQKDDSVEYYAFLYTNVETGDNEPYNELKIDEELKSALDFMVLKEREENRK